jgi:8-oxo-dGTP pyrophosphatase MutT (NUDIX family)
MTSTSEPAAAAAASRGTGSAAHAGLGNWHRAPKEPAPTVVYQNPWFQIKSRDGYFSLEYGQPQVVVLVLVGEEVLLVRVRRPLVDDEPWELPAGGSHPGESPLAAARRELHEETGILIEESERFEPLPMISEMPNRSPELLICFQVRITPEEFARREEHDKEITELRLWGSEALKQAIRSGEFYLAAPTAILARHLLLQEAS